MLSLSSSILVNRKYYRMHLPIPLLYHERLANASNYFYLCHYWFNHFPDESADAIEKTAVVLFAEYTNQEY